MHFKSEFVILQINENSVFLPRETIYFKRLLCLSESGDNINQPDNLCRQILAKKDGFPWKIILITFYLGLSLCGLILYY